MCLAQLGFCMRHFRWLSVCELGRVIDLERSCAWQKREMTLENKIWAVSGEAEKIPRYSNPDKPGVSAWYCLVSAIEWIMVKPGVCHELGCIEQLLFLVESNLVLVSWWICNLLSGRKVGLRELTRTRMQWSFRCIARVHHIAESHSKGFITDIDVLIHWRLSFSTVRWIEHTTRALSSNQTLSPPRGISKGCDTSITNNQ
jgi:hypothetical protein